MEIETLQIKRVTGNWDKYKTIKPLKGEYVLVDTTINGKITKTLVLGTSTDGKDGYTLETLITKADCIIPFKSDNSEDIIANINNLQPISNTNNISATSNDKGAGTQFAYSDHTHKLEKSTAEEILNTNTNISEFNCRRIKAGTGGLPTDAKVGDIYIKYSN